MKAEALCHIPKSNYAYAYQENELHIRLRTAKNDMKEVYIIYGVKFDWKGKQKHAMKKILSDQYYDYYQYEIRQEDLRIGYYFELVSDEQRTYFMETGLTGEFRDEQAHCHYFQYPYLSSRDLHVQPSWIHDTVFYEIFVERFNNGDKENSPKNLSEWGELPKSKSFFGGDLKGITDKLDYLEDLGINGIYLTPIFTSPSNHKYDVVNYFEIDPYFGTKEIAREFVQKAHEKGIKIILDAVFNHCSDSFPPFLDVRENGKASPYYDWFFVEGDRVEQNPPNYRMFGFVRSMPKLNTNNAKLRDYLLDCARYWTEELGIDGWRLDVSDEVEHEFWREFRKLIKGINPEAIIIGENWHDAYPWLMGDQFDGIMNYSVTKSCVDYFAKGEITARDFEHQLSGYLMRYPKQVNAAMLNLLDSHDTERFLYSAGEDTRALKNAAAFLFAFQGMPCTYYGTEIGMTGNYDPGCRRTFDWNRESWDIEVYEYYKQLIRLRKLHKTLKAGEIEFLSSDSVFAMKRTYEEEQILILINASPGPQEYYLGTSQFGRVTELMSGQTWEPVEGSIVIPENTALYIKFA
jgi:cyclomaltodextrinase